MNSLDSSAPISDSVPSREMGDATRWMKIAVALWISFGVAVGVKALVQPTRHAVYPTFADASRRWWQDESLYTRGYYYSPVFAVALTPIALLPKTLGGIVWGTLGLAFLFWCLRVFFRSVIAPLRDGLDEGKYLLLCLAPSVHGAWSGQSNMLLLGLVLLTATCALQGRWWRAALLLAMAVHVKVWVLALAALFAVRHWRALLPRLAVCLLAVAVLPLLTRPPLHVVDSYQQFHACLVERFAEAERWGGYRDAWTMWEAVAAPEPAIYKALQVVSGLLAAAWCLRQARRGVTGPAFLLGALAMWVCWQLLFGSGTERLTYGILAPAAGWAVLESFAAKRHRILALGAWLFTGPLGTGDVERLLLRAIPFAQAMMPLGVAMLALWLALCERSLPGSSAIQRSPRPRFARRPATALELRA